MTELLLNGPTLNKRLRKLMEQSRIDNTETLTALDTRHKTKTNKATTN